MVLPTFLGRQDSDLLHKVSVRLARRNVPSLVPRLSRSECKGDLASFPGPAPFRRLHASLEPDPTNHGADRFQYKLKAIRPRVGFGSGLRD